MSETENSKRGQKPKFSRLAIWSLVLAIAGLLTGMAFFGTLFIPSWMEWSVDWLMIIGSAIIFFPFVVWILGLIMGIVALGKIKESSGLLKGRGLAIAGVVTSGVGLTLACLCIMRARRIHSISPRVVCGTNLRGLGKAMLIYASDYDEQYPTVEKWCDLLVMYCEVGPRQFVCPSSDAKEGESSFAFNKNLIGKKPTEVPPDVVLLFETNFGKNPLGRQALLAERDWHEFLEYPDSGKKVYKLRWNQFGGPEILTTENHKGKGCNILFNDLHVEFVKTERLGELEWEVEEEEENGSGNFRRPGNDEELKYWLENMVWYHRFTNKEISAAMGLTEKSIVAALAKFDIRPDNQPRRAKDTLLLVLPYPGGRHPRIGFLDGAIDPQRETKFSVFTPWDANSYVVVDVPEAIWSNLGLTYLAHTHIDTIWTKQDIVLPRLEWNRHPDGTLDIERKLPNGIVFGVKVKPTKEAVWMELWLKNGTDKKLSDLRVQNCVMTKMAANFEQQSNDNKVFTNPYECTVPSDFSSKRGTRKFIIDTVETDNSNFCLGNIMASSMLSLSMTARAIRKF